MCCSVKSVSTWFLNRQTSSEIMASVLISARGPRIVEDDERIEGDLRSGDVLNFLSSPGRPESSFSENDLIRNGDFAKDGILEEGFNR